MSLPVRHQVLAAAAFTTALGTGYVANLDESDDAMGLSAPAPAHAPILARSSALATATRGDWPPMSEEALRGWGGTSGGREPAAAPASRNATEPAAGRAANAPPPVPEAPQSAPVEPPPWRLIGRLDEGGVPRALLATPQQVLVVAELDTLQSRWRVERIGVEDVELRELATGQRLRLGWEATR